VPFGTPVDSWRRTAGGSEAKSSILLDMKKKLWSIFTKKRAGRHLAGRGSRAADTQCVSRSALPSCQVPAGPLFSENGHCTYVNVRLPLLPTLLLLPASGAACTFQLCQPHNAQDTRHDFKPRREVTVHCSLFNALTRSHALPTPSRTCPVVSRAPVRQIASGVAQSLAPPPP
jgi:hypothetical protein